MNSSEPTAPRRLGVVTVSFDSQQVLPGFLASLATATTLPHQVVVADNRPSESGEIDDIARENGALYLPLSTNPGYGAGMNRAVEMLDSSVEWILISNPDVVLGRDSVDILIAEGDRDPSIGAVGPAILTSSGDIYPSARRVPSIRTGVGHALFYNLWPNNTWSRAYLSELDIQARDAGWLSGACLLVRREAFEKIRGFDEGYFMYFEDVDLGDRLSKAGYRNVYRPQSTVTHSGAHSTGSASERMLREHHKSASRFLSNKYSGALLLPVRIVLRASLSIRAGIEARRTRRR